MYTVSTSAVLYDVPRKKQKIPRNKYAGRSKQLRGTTRNSGKEPTLISAVTGRPAAHLSYAVSEGKGR